jgi:hypothetical protein
MFRSFMISLFLVSLIVPSWAQTAEILPDAPTVQSSQPTERRVIRKEEDPRPAMILPIFDKPFAIATAGLVGSSIANAEAIVGCEPKACQAVPGSLRSRAALYAIGIPVDIGIGYVSYRLRQSRYHRWWYVPMGVITFGNIIYATHAVHCSGNGCRYFSGPRD